MSILKIFPDPTRPDPASRASAEAMLLKAKADPAIAAVQQQIDTHKIKAAWSSVFVAGWRPAVGWTCAAAFATIYVVLPIANWIAQVAGHAPIVIAFDTATLLTVLGGMMGLGFMRTAEKVAGVSKGH